MQLIHVTHLEELGLLEGRGEGPQDHLIHPNSTLCLIRPHSLFYGLTPFVLRAPAKMVPHIYRPTSLRELMRGGGKGKTCREKKKKRTNTTVPP